MFDVLKYTFVQAQTFQLVSFLFRTTKTDTKMKQKVIKFNVFFCNGYGLLLQKYEDEENVLLEYFGM